MAVGGTMKQKFSFIVVCSMFFILIAVHNHVVSYYIAKEISRQRYSSASRLNRCLLVQDVLSIPSYERNELVLQVKESVRRLRLIYPRTLEGTIDLDYFKKELIPVKDVFR